MGRASSTNGREKELVYYWSESQKGRDHKENQDVGGWIILRWLLERCNEVEWNGLVCLRIRTSGWVL
jgi:hypothetical protein